MTKNPHQKPTATSNDKQKPPKGLTTFWVDWKGRLLDPITLFTLLLVVVGFLQWTILKQTDETLRLQNRAWIAPIRLIPPENFKHRIDAYTEVNLGYENVGKEPAIKTNEVIVSTVIPKADFRDPIKMKAAVLNAMGGKDCETMTLNEDGRAIFPAAKVGMVVGFDAEQVIKINKRTHFPLVAGCIIYETMSARHTTRLCMILEAIGDSDEWRSDPCLVHNKAD